MLVFEGLEESKDLKIDTFLAFLKELAIETDFLKIIFILEL